MDLIDLLHYLRSNSYNVYIVLSNIWTFLALIVTQTVTFYQFEISIKLFYYLDVEEQEESFTKEAYKCCL